jgi:hypothetical protein
VRRPLGRCEQRLLMLPGDELKGVSVCAESHCQSIVVGFHNVGNIKVRRLRTWWSVSRTDVEVVMLFDSD